MYEYEQLYQQLFKKYGLHCIFLISPQTSPQRIKKADELSSGFIYAVSSSATTGGDTDLKTQRDYFKKISSLKLKNPVLIGFGIKDRATFDLACMYAAGAIIGSAYIKAIKHSEDINGTTREFIQQLKTV